MLFTLANWDAVCRYLVKNSDVVSVDQYLNGETLNNCVILKHDVEYDIDKAVSIGKIESELGIRSTFYFQFDVAVSSPSKVVELQGMGHEIGYHYDVLDANNGNYELAINQFREHLHLFSELGVHIKSVCPHGNPIKTRVGWSSNKDFFRNPDVRTIFSEIVDIVVDCALIFPPGFWYISDAGYEFKLIGDIANNDKVAIVDKKISVLTSLPFGEESIIISTHPHRWMKSNSEFLIKRGVFLLSRKIAKKLSRVSFLKPIFDSFYHVARRF